MDDSAAAIGLLGHWLFFILDASICKAQIHAHGITEYRHVYLLKVNLVVQKTEVHTGTLISMLLLPKLLPSPTATTSPPCGLV